MAYVHNELHGIIFHKIELFRKHFFACRLFVLRKSTKLLVYEHVI
jgi:hypothetical protein